MLPLVLGLWKRHSPADPEGDAAEAGDPEEATSGEETVVTPPVEATSGAVDVTPVSSDPPPAAVLAAAPTPGEGKGGQRSELVVSTMGTDQYSMCQLMRKWCSSTCYISTMLCAPRTSGARREESGFDSHSTPDKDQKNNAQNRCDEYIVSAILLFLEGKMR